MLVSLTVGKVDAGVAVLLTEDKRLIEFPSILLPPDIHSGSIVDINVSRNLPAETRADQHFSALQNEIYSSFGTATPSAPVLRCRNATQTSVVLEWDPLDLATAELRSLSLYRNGTKAGVIPRDKLSTKISGLALDTDYTFHLVLRTSAGQYSSERLVVRTQKMTDLSGITITPGVMPPQLRENLEETAERVGAKMVETVRIDTTHFVCTEPRGQAWEKAVEMNVPVVVPDWLMGCEREGRVVGVRGYYLDADPKLRQMGQPSQQVMAAQRLSTGPNSQQQRESPRIEHTPPTPERTTQGDGFGGQAGGEPPTPPPKPASERLAEERASGEEQQMGETARPKVDAQEREVSEEDEESDGTEQEERSAGVASPEQQPKTKAASADSDEDDEGSERGEGKDDRFDEVAL
ncbi:uncharacterized protein LTR77_000245 [Saxophila tyrrhenica]|uniref:Chitin biosynthesis protein CHS5 n=1 Tax=Saxophila tyrrhenica TaxID=1690608 RepID=A0AAV9PRW7_9PEZI|nr:hypothetical protein LTR77_000245 [Saxophila tyrrhenica]